jgi:hypothetical protein
MESEYTLKRINKHIYLKNVTSFLQHEINVNGKKKLLTFIGEIHINNTKCKTFDTNKCIEHKEKILKSIDIGDYLLTRITLNPHTKILLEYSPTLKPEEIGSYKSESLQSIYKYIKTNNDISKKFINSIIPTDYRRLFLEDKQTELYANPYLNSKPKDYIYYNFIEPFYKKYYLIHITEDSPYKYSDNDLKYIGSYISNTDNVFKEITQNLGKDIIDIPKLQRNWANITELFSLKEIFNINTLTDEYIIIVGEAHIANWEKIFSGLPPLVKKTVSIYDTCICLFGTYTISH